MIDRSGGRAVLFLTTVWPGARRSGGEVVSQAFIEALRGQGQRVFVVAYRRPGESNPEHPDDLIAGTRPIETHEAGGLALLWLARAVLTGLPYSVAKYASAAYRKRVAGLLREYPDAVVIYHAQSAWMLRSVPPTLPSIYLAYNVEHHLYAEHAATLRGLRRGVYEREARRVRQVEEQLLHRAGHVWALSDQDAEAFKHIDEAVTVRRFAALPAVGRASSPPDTDVVMLGKWSWAANAVGLDWFLDYVVPHLAADLRVEIAGVGAERDREHRPNVLSRGPVESATDFLCRGRVIAIPSRAGGGVQVKTLDAIATGRPVVATSFAVRGIESLPPTVHISDDPAGFAQLLAQAVAEPPLAFDDEAVDAWIAARRLGFEVDVRDALDRVLEDAGGVHV
jgi:hypothetical protein